VRVDDFKALHPHPAPLPKGRGNKWMGTNLAVRPFKISDGWNIRIADFSIMMTNYPEIIFRLYYSVLEKNLYLFINGKLLTEMRQSMGLGYGHLLLIPFRP
jgi:hypothetical protein